MSHIKEFFIINNQIIHWVRFKFKPIIYTSISESKINFFIESPHFVLLKAIDISCANIREQDVAILTKLLSLFKS